MRERPAGHVSPESTANGTPEGKPRLGPLPLLALKARAGGATAEPRPPLPPRSSEEHRHRTGAVRPLPLILAIAFGCRLNIAAQYCLACKRTVCVLEPTSGKIWNVGGERQTKSSLAASTQMESWFVPAPSFVGMPEVTTNLPGKGGRTGVAEVWPWSAPSAAALRGATTTR
jgi:hypothetical protein